MQENQGQLIYSFLKSEGEEIKFSVKKYKGRQFLDLRLWFKGEEDTEFRPTKKGLFLALDQFSELRKGVERLGKAVEKLRTRQSQPEEIEV